MARLKRGKTAFGCRNDLWTLKRVAEVTRKGYAVKNTLSGVWRVLRAPGLSTQVPLTIALERDETYIRKWVRSVWPEILDRDRRTNATLLFVDESGIQTSPNVRGSWTREGSRPVLRTKSRR
jgi:Winged helix-turn helix